MTNKTRNEKMMNDITMKKIQKIVNNCVDMGLLIDDEKGKDQIRVFQIKNGEMFFILGLWFSGKELK